MWREPDQGIWEARGKPQHYVSSKLMCWVAHGPRGEARGDPRRARRWPPSWAETADEIKADILEHGVDKRGVLRQHYETDALDASTLLAAIFGFLPGDDERLRASVLAIADELTEHGFVLRYRTDETDDGLSGKEGTFVICSFWLVSALAIIGEMQRARDLMERLVRVASPLGLYAEEFDVDTGRHLGNFPQAFSHLALVEAAGADHPRRASRGDDRMSDSYDVIVIGSGAGGGTLVHHLAPSGKRILLLERGGWLPREPQNWLAEDVFVDGRYISPDTWYYADGSSRSSRRCTTSSAARRSSTAPRCTGCASEDFGELRHHDGISPAWPISYEEMEPYYTQAEQLYQVHGARGEDPTEPPASAPYPFPAVSHEPRIQQLSDDLAEAGLHPFHAPCGILLDEAQHAVQPLRALRQLRRLPVPRPRQVRRRGDRGPAGARAPERDAADRTPRRCGCETNDAGTAVTGVVVEHDGEQETFARRHRRRLLRRRQQRQAAAGLRDRQAPGGLANGSDQVGRNYMFHNSQAVLALSKEENPTVFQKTLGVNDFYFSGGEDFEFPLGQHPDGRQVAGADVPRREAGRDAVRAELVAGGRRPPRGRLLALDRGPAAAREPRHAGERRQHRDRLHARATRSPRSASTTSSSRCSRTSACTTGTCCRTTRTSRTRSRSPACAHQAGTCRFGTDPASSVLNTDCRAHELDNLYVVDTSFFPSIGAVNPALTAMANALRVGDHLLERMGARGAATGTRRASRNDGQRPRALAVRDHEHLPLPVRAGDDRAGVPGRDPADRLVPHRQPGLQADDALLRDAAADQRRDRRRHRLVQEFEFGMNWSTYSRFVGGVFGAPLAMEGLLAFFLESTFLGLWLFGWDRLPKRVHLATIWAVSIGTMLSAMFILIANSWMQHPVGYKLNRPGSRC